MFNSLPIDFPNAECHNSINKSYLSGFAVLSRLHYRCTCYCWPGKSSRATAIGCTAKLNTVESIITRTFQVFCIPRYYGLKTKFEDQFSKIFFLSQSLNCGICMYPLIARLPALFQSFVISLSQISTINHINKFPQLI